MVIVYDFKLAIQIVLELYVSYLIRLNYLLLSIHFDRNSYPKMGKQ